MLKAESPDQNMIRTKRVVKFLGKFYRAKMDTLNECPGSVTLLSECLLVFIQALDF